MLYLLSLSFSRYFYLSLFFFFFLIFFLLRCLAPCLLISLSLQFTPLSISPDSRSISCTLTQNIPYFFTPPPPSLPSSDINHLLSVSFYCLSLKCPSFLFLQSSPLHATFIFPLALSLKNKPDSGLGVIHSNRIKTSRL